MLFSVYTWNLGSYDLQIFSFSICILPVSKRVCQFTLSAESMRVLIAPHPRQHFIIKVFFHCSHSGGCVITLKGGFNLHFLKDQCSWILNTFLFVYCPFVYPLKCVPLFLFIFLFYWLHFFLVFRSTLCILDISHNVL